MRKRLKPEEFNRLRDIVLDVVKVTGDRRVEILEQRCSSDEELRAALKLLEFDTGPDGLGSALHLAGSVPEAGENLGRYRVVRQIGVGGMGVVLAALDPSLDREVAVKVLPDWMAENPGAHRRFRQEARLLARLNHSNIATVYSLEQEQHYVFLTMELVPGRSLSDLLRSGAMSVDTALSLARQLASAVEAAHDQGVIHRDLKPSNVMVTDSGVVKVLDFGIAKLTGQLDNGGSDSDEADPSTGAMGTPGYMSPEQIHGGPTDHRTDVWSFGCVLFDCLAGRPAFGGETRRARLEATLRKDPDLDLLAEETPPPAWSGHGTRSAAAKR